MSVKLLDDWLLHEEHDSFFHGKQGADGSTTDLTETAIIKGVVQHHWYHSHDDISDMIREVALGEELERVFRPVGSMLWYSAAMSTESTPRLEFEGSCTDCKI